MSGCVSVLKARVCVKSACQVVRFVCEASQVLTMALVSVAGRERTVSVRKSSETAKRFRMAFKLGRAALLRGFEALASLRSLTRRTEADRQVGPTAAARWGRSDTIGQDVRAATARRHAGFPA